MLARRRCFRAQLERFVPEPRLRRHPQLARGKTSDPDLARPACCVADRAVGSDQDLSFVYVVDSKNITRLRHIKTGQLAEGLRVVKSGLQPDDVVIINGIIKVRPDSPVRPQQ